MHPLIVAFLPEALQIIKAIGNSEVGKNIASGGIKKIIEVAIPQAKKASQLQMAFLENKSGVAPGNNKDIILSQPLDIVDNWLSLPLSYQENQFTSINQKISDDLDIIKGQNEILFLSNSIQYFIEGHRSRIGIDRGISYALQYDIAAVCHYLQKRKELRFPGYLLHQLTSLAQSIQDLNIFYSSLLSDGHVPAFDEEDISAELTKEFGIDKRKSDLGNYIPHEMKLRLLRRHSGTSDGKNAIGSLISSLKDHVLTKDEANGSAHDAIYILKEELISNEVLEYKIVKKLFVLPGKKLFVESCNT